MSRVLYHRKAFVGRPITVEDLVNGTQNMEFQASSIGEAPWIINEMRAWRAPDPGDKRQYFSAIPQTLYLPVCVAYSDISLNTDLSRPW
ncbi:Deoxyhypusine synthase [Aspergillus alliaceus]|uniref:Deoxyhypusine synthase n=1 Tax=Petromyces alliaceus TaxID=209559 RepID=A0A8H6A913_PETAA|nr:Deoxyhypusine synthase [Aspergillus burnettii]